MTNVSRYFVVTVWRIVAVWMIGCIALPSGAWAQLKAPDDRIDELEETQKELEKELAKIKKDRKKDKADKKKGNVFANGLLTLGENKFRLRGKMELLFIDTENDFFSSIGEGGSATDNSDPHLIFQRLRLEPVISLNRQITLIAQIDFEPSEGETLLKEAIAVHRVDPAWWFGSHFQIGVDDRFIRPSRRTKGYPLIGNSFWRGESLAAIWRLSFGNRNGKPRDENGDTTPVIMQGERGPGSEGFDRDEDLSIDSVAKPFDFIENWGQIRAYASVGQGNELRANEVAFDRAEFNDIVQDGRNLEDDLSLRELGGGVEYRRNFQSFGNLGVMGYYINDELRDGSVSFLQNDLTLFDEAGNVVGGYGLSDSRASYRWGARLDYFLPQTSIFGEIFEERRRNGLRLAAEWIRGIDGDLVREGWYTQLSYRVSFGKLVQKRYFRSIEPLVRYGRLNINLEPEPELPGTWDRSQLMIGGIVEVTGDIFLKFEYAIHGEVTGGARTGRDKDSVDNNELLIQLLLRF